jgi:hypothetical protein
MNLNRERHDVIPSFVSPSSPAVSYSFLDIRSPPRSNLLICLAY